MLKIIGIGGGGCNILSYLMKKGFEGVEFVAVSRHQKSLSEHEAKNKIKLSYYGVQNIINQDTHKFPSESWF